MEGSSYRPMAASMEEGDATSTSKGAAKYASIEYLLYDSDDTDSGREPPFGKLATNRNISARCCKISAA